MNFQYPAFLFALFSIVIPILIHFFNFRRYKTIYFSNVDVLQNIKKQTHRKNELKHLLILLARIMTIIFLVFAFARPFIPAGGDSRNRSGETIAFYIDNSFSMNALSEKGRLLDEAVRLAIDIADSYQPGTGFKLYTNDMQSRHNLPFYKDQLIKELTNIKPSSSTIPLSLIDNRFELESGNDNTGTLFYISDFQRSITDPENFNNGRNINYFIPLFPSEVKNLYIDSCWMEVPAHALNQQENIFVRIKNISDEDYNNLPVRLYLNDSLKSITNFSVTSNSEVITNLKYTNVSGGIQLGRIEITDYPFTHDNIWYFSYFVEPKLKTLAIFSDSEYSLEGLSYISSLLEEDEYIILETMNIQSLQISKLPEYNAIFLTGIDNYSTGFLNELAEAVSNGTSVVFFPSPGNNQIHDNLFLSKFRVANITGIDSVRQPVSGIDYDNNFFKNVFQERRDDAVMPEISFHYKFEEKSLTPEANLLWFRNGNKAMSVSPFDKGKVWIFAFPLTKTNEAFARDIIFVPAIYNIVLNSIPDQRTTYTVGKDMAVMLPKSMNVDIGSSVEIDNKETGNKFIPGITVTNQGSRIELNNMIENAGQYLVKTGEKTITSFAFNYNRDESDLKYTGSTELTDKIKAAGLTNTSVITSIERTYGDIIDEINRGRQLWKYCIIAALLFIITEVLISRFMK
ncbi:MAG: BatA domain-containing protein [Prolixibacteraceae bacterium]|jgi:hypothetical protein|nr:BatA domain-containing protein [Prolixibacteraceae bacterium]NLO03145.1 hypothetical protein [Bacteroidales bacterium]